RLRRRRYRNEKYGQPRDSAILDQPVPIAKNFKPLDPIQIAAILRRTALAAENGEYELFRASAHFDCTAQHPEWLGKKQTAQIKQLTSEKGGQLHSSEPHPI